MTYILAFTPIFLLILFIIYRLHKAQRIRFFHNLINFPSYIFNLKYGNDIDDLLNKYANRAFDSIYIDQVLVYMKDGIYPDEKILGNIKESYVDFFEELAGPINVLLFVKYYGSFDSYFKSVSYVFDNRILSDKILKMKREKQLKGEDNKK